MNKNQQNTQDNLSKIFYLLEELKENFSEELLSETLECLLDGEGSTDEFLGKGKELDSLLNGQHEKFYDSLAFEFVEDMNNTPEMYFLYWESLIECLNEKSKSRFYETAIEHSGTTDAHDYVNGMKCMESGNLELANVYFSRIKGYVASYFVGLVYLHLEAYENAIKSNENFLVGFLDMIENTKENEGDDSGLSDTHGVLIVLWNLHNDFGFLYNRTEEYEKAKYHYEKGLEIFDIESTYHIKDTYLTDKDLSEFNIWINNYLLCLEKTNEKDRAIEILNFAIDKYPSSEYYKSLKQKFES